VNIQSSNGNHVVNEVGDDGSFKKEIEKEELKKELLMKDAEIKMLRETIEAMAKKIAFFKYQNHSMDSLTKLAKDAK